MLFWLLLKVMAVRTGPLSYYHPGDGNCGKTTACGKRFTFAQEHIALRDWYRLGCGRKVYVCAHATRRCATTRVGDGGPYVVYPQALSYRQALKRRRFKVWVKTRPPRGWRFREVADLSHGLWLKLGKPRYRSNITIVVLPRH